MANLTPADSFDDVYQLETTDPVIGGAGGISNLQGQKLLNRTEWLKNRIGIWSLANVIEKTTTGTVGDNEVGLLIVVNASGNVTITIDSVGSFTTKPAVMHFKFLCVAGKSITLQTSGGETIRFGGWNGSETRTKLYFKDGEYLRLLVTNTGFEILGVSPGIYEVGDCVDAYVSRRNTAVRQGTVLNRADEPRLWEWISNSLIDGHELVDDTTWGSSIIVNNGTQFQATVNPYKGCFSKGNGTTTFRLPDDRGMYNRYLDLSRGIDTGRLHNYAGGYEHDALINHKHKSGLFTNSKDYVDGTSATNNIGDDDTPVNPAGTVLPIYTEIVGTAGEQRVKSTGKVPLIKL